jgi:anti-anti-sigma factor
MYVNSADYQINPPELGIAEREIKHVKKGRFVLVPITDELAATAHIHRQSSGGITWLNYCQKLNRVRGRKATKDGIHEVLTMVSYNPRMPSDKLAVESVPGSKAGESIVKLNGPLVLNTLFGFQDTMQQLTGNLTMIDLEGVPYVDSAGLGSLVKFFVSYKRHGRKLILVAPCEQVQSLMSMTKVETLFEIFPTIADAQRSVVAGASS